MILAHCGGRGWKINKRVVSDIMMLFRVWTYIIIEIKCKNSWSNLINRARFWNLKFVRICDFTRIDSQKSPSLPQFLRYRAHLLAMAFMADLQGAIFPNLVINFSLIVGNLSPASFNWKINILSQGKNSTALPAMAILYKNLKGIKCQFLNSPL